ncbi:hypothetical protein OO17_09955 [Rhodopseudomonas palustris]|uniref:Uncharacterized protein n=1 Tax=Rhodopseudomonas palustris TaxID=1076 RepID=A0A0D7EU94_RHOPL|nr:hypothetical protein OO17_09955 [Rhodopseudomonas palustris]
MRFVAVPADTDAGLVLGAEDLGDAYAGTAECFNPMDQRIEPARNRIRWQKTARRIIVAPAKRGHAALSLILAELERLKREARCVSDEFQLLLPGDEARDIIKPLRKAGFFCKKGKLIGQSGSFARYHGQVDMGS